MWLSFCFLHHGLVQHALVLGSKTNCLFYLVHGVLEHCMAFLELLIVLSQAFENADVFQALDPVSLVARVKLILECVLER